MIINFFIMLGSFLDLLLTYKFLGLYKRKFPKKDWTVIEANPLIKYCVKTKGLNEGMFIAGSIILILALALVFVLSERWKFFLAGVYYMMVLFHLTNFLAISRLKGGKTNGNKKNKA